MKSTARPSGTRAVRRAKPRSKPRPRASQSRAEERFQQFVERADYWMWETDAEHRFTYFSANFEALSGFHRTQLLGHRRDELIGAGEVPEGWAKYQAALAAREPFRNLIYHAVGPGGRSVWLKVEGRPLFGQDGDFAGYRGICRDVTAEIEAERALRTSNRRFLALLDISTDWLWETDADLRFTYFSPNFEAAVGVPAATLVGKHSDEIGDVDEAHADAYRAALAAHAPIRNFIFKRTFADGRSAWIKTSATPSFDAAGRFIGYRGVASNVTAAIEAEEAERALRRFNEALNELRYGLVMYDQDKRLVAFNKAFADLHRDRAGRCILAKGMPYEDIVKWRFANDFYAPPAEGGLADSDSLVEQMQRRNSFAFRLRDGRWMLLDRYAFKEGGSFGVWTDITSVKDAADRLRRSQQHLELAQRIGGMGSSEHDLRTGERIWSEELYRLHGVDRSFAINEASIAALIHEEDRPRVAAARSRAIAGEPIEPIEFRILRPDGEVRTLYREMETIRDESGMPVRLLSTFKDVTELRTAERRRKEAEEQLLHAQKLEALGTLAGGVAHELNNTLVPVLGLAKLTMRRLPEGSRERDNLATILQAGEKARDLVKRILAFSRNEMPKRVEVDLAEVTRQALALLRHSLPSTMRIDEAIEPVPSLLGDPGQLSQVVINLVVNAVQATPEQKGVVAIEVASADIERLPQLANATVAATAAVRLSVIDYGIGMDQAIVARAFEPFFTTKPPGEGTGLGLSVLHGIVTQHGGRVAVDSKPGKGTRFDVYLPAGTAADNRDRPVTAVAEANREAV